MVYVRLMCTLTGQMGDWDSLSAAYGKPVKKPHADGEATPHRAEE